MHLLSAQNNHSWWLTKFILQQFQGEESADLYLEERETQLKAAQEDKRKVQMAIPGMLNPHDMPEEMQD